MEKRPTFARELGEASSCHQGYDPFAAAATGDACPSDDTARVMLIAAEMYELLILAMLRCCESVKNGEIDFHWSPRNYYTPEVQHGT